MAQPPFVVAVVGDHGPTPPDWMTAAWVAGRDIAYAGAWVAFAPPSPVGYAAAVGAREHGGVTLAVLTDDQHLVEPDDVPASLIIRTGGGRHGRAVTLSANLHALLALPGDPETMAQIAAAQMLGVPTVQLGQPYWSTVETILPTEVPAWLERLGRERASAAPQPPPAPSETPAAGNPQVDQTRDTPDSASTPANSRSSS